MSVRRLFLGKIENMAEQAADRCTKTMKYTHPWTLPER